MKDSTTLLVFVAIAFLVIIEVRKRIAFNQGILYHHTVLLKYRNYTPFSVWGVVMGC